jgi:hypothetical protein
VLLKPVLAVIPILSTAGQRIVGFVAPALANAGTAVSAQSAGQPVRATSPDAAGRFVLYPVAIGNYDLVITASGRVNAVMTGVPVSGTASTVIGSDSVRLNTPLSANAFAASGAVTVNASVVETNAAVRALQSLTGGPTIEVGYSAADATTGAYRLTLPSSAPVRAPFVAGATGFTFTAEPIDAGKYRLEASAPSSAVKVADILLVTDVVTPFAFP